MSANAGMKRVVLVIAVVTLTGAASCAQTAESQDKCTLAGTVVDATSQQLVRDATVSLRGPLPADRSASKIAPAVTDSSGRFSFDNLPPGRYLVFASHQGYVNQGPGTRGPRLTALNLVSGQHLDDLVVYLTPGGIISGQISGAGGKPVSGVTLQALKRSHRFGKPEFDEMAIAVSSKSGEYRLTALPPGDYYLRAVPPPQPKADAKGTEIHVPTYYPGTADQSRSALLVLRAGEQLSGIDMALSRVRTAVVSGRVIDAVTKSPIRESELTLVEEGNVTPVPFSATTDAKGNFEVKGVPRGSYLLMAEKAVQLEKDKPMWGKEAVQVGDVDVHNVEVAISRGVEVSGRILVDGKANLDLTQLTGGLQAEPTSTLRRFTPRVENAPVKPDGSFMFQDVPEGSYRINFFPIPAGFYLKSGQIPDVLETGVAVIRGQAIRILQLTLSSGVARIEGTVMKDQQPSPGTVVVLVPSPERRSLPRYYWQTVSDSQGRFALQNIIPGDYEVFAWQEIERGSYMDPDFLAQFEGHGKAVSIKDGADLNLQIDVIPAD
jgi:uncharacterized protein (DUF2141 family)